MDDEKEICADIPALFKSCEEWRLLTNEEDATTNVDNEKMICFGDILVLAEIIFSIYHRPAGSLTYAELNDVEETIDILLRFSQEYELSVTIKAHILETHLMLFLRRCRGM